MLLSALEMNNSLFEEAGSAFRLKEDLSGGDKDYDMYAARKNGKPKDDYPSKSQYVLNHTRLRRTCARKKCKR